MKNIMQDVLPENVPADAVPIREISRLTGINTVTLRAWERRYGLLKPLRTTKGHRLYSHADIVRVKEIQQWLGRGLAISKVNAILNNKMAQQEPLHIDSLWIEIAEKIHSALADFNRRQLERVWEDILALYTAEMIADELLLPILIELQGDVPAKPARLAFFRSVVFEHLYRVQYRQRQTAHGEKLLLLSSSSNDEQLLPLIFSYGLLVNEYQSEFVGHINSSEAFICAEALEVKALILLGYETLDATQLQLHLQQWSEKNQKPVVLVGRIASLYAATASAINPHIYACETQQHAIAVINTLFRPTGNVHHTDVKFT